MTSSRRCPRRRSRAAPCPAARPEGEPPPESIAPAHQLPHPHLLWVQEHLHHLSASAQTVSEPGAAARRGPPAPLVALAAAGAGPPGRAGISAADSGKQLPA